MLRSHRSRQFRRAAKVHFEVASNLRLPTGIALAGLEAEKLVKTGRFSEKVLTSNFAHFFLLALFSDHKQRIGP